MNADSQRVQFPPGNWVAPAGSYRSDEGRKRNPAFETNGSLLAIRRADPPQADNASERPASNRPTWSPTVRIYG
jgi:hypothetical protein